MKIACIVFYTTYTILAAILAASIALMIRF